MITQSQLDPVDGSFIVEDETATPSFPPVDDAVAFFKNIDWADVRRRTFKGLNNVGLLLAVVGEKTHDLGAYLANLKAE